MNNKLEQFKKDVKNKRVAVMGIGVSNIPLIKYLVSFGVDVTAFDKSTEEKLTDAFNELKGLPVKYSLGPDYLSRLNGFDMIFRTPGMRPDLPELVEAVANGAELTSEMEVFLKLCPAQVFAVTGSDGKTTTTTLIYKTLSEEGFKCWLGGNIGTPLLSKIDDVAETDKVILELSSFQLMTIKDCPSVAVITNISPNHLDVHKSLQEYIDAKKNIFINQNENDKLVLNFDNEITKSFNYEARGEYVYFSRLNNINEGVVYQNGRIIVKKENSITEIIEGDKIKIPGVHNIENYMAATAATIDYVKPETIARIASSFNGVEHRIELVRELNGVKFYNSSIDSSPSRTIAALKTFKDKVILIAGGKDKGIPYDSMGEIITEKVKCLLLIGATASRIEEAYKNYLQQRDLENDIKIIHCDTYQEVVQKAHAEAEQGDCIILSPASTSFDMFKNFEHRGNVFKELVNNLK
ncbi:UDP-N-acetylmuramoyl-L-alanine--D-glutamate ligase [Ruminiclostridium cellulolyticum]|uniref:UDP-N-acetylmuramoylalanine--D-glutamate ligase n=1 Tax=Ruminiclostridium cellulolyticum (strain ATCC 35319 / DSM 5812 / JCM 6584 / H10) TaxID=394503 RepID=MURD_RUMCH|nr:UDP-N-acetylmuramoyl-L-alanine--D-glutamate ligase [Ruminiclostridium cellulolyticum]B8I2T4.1 RecName: Full=UDP-N-acetylmuramoylalanine--D-glutamate ligase; AltName: Full=D-glutamic acid-adding enzyme; AltName: Full=UDP-N-acetylmuramoyl-L-alanyl-D-glutamate synthetase [Ruminiclostridium cellulolyticum H10]ACL76077.1 UDP-N-acetylmuramoylalanine/D-glutamate ligase [Ruminiclostridium cellulolyticum H10]